MIEAGTHGFRVVAVLIVSLPPFFHSFLIAAGGGRTQNLPFARPPSGVLPWHSLPYRIQNSVTAGFV